MVEIDKALTDPSANFKKPQDVVENKDLSAEQKIEILRRWEYDARELQVADEEGMSPEVPPPTVLDAVLKALRCLGARRTSNGRRRRSKAEHERFSLIRRAGPMVHDYSKIKTPSPAHSSSE